VNISGQVAVVTGADGGIGLACARRLLDAGASVVGVDLSTEQFEGLASHGPVCAIEADLTSPDVGEQVVRGAVKKFGRLDILINNAGRVGVREGFLSVTDEEWDQTLGLNLMGYVRMSRAAIPAFLQNGGGCMVHVASEAARMPNPRLPDYSVSKAAVLMLSKVLSAEFAPRGIRSNVVSPAFIRTPLYDREGGIGDSLATEFGMDRESAIQKYVEINGIPAGRLGTVDEVASMVHYLVSAEASFVTGANFAVDGGVTPVI
jgi:NAD(P)-dependent dehydrogenase (short-subunit alcohol dehydrogenase family)